MHACMYTNTCMIHTYCTIRCTATLVTRPHIFGPSYKQVSQVCVFVYVIGMCCCLHVSLFCVLQYLYLPSVCMAHCMLCIMHVVDYMLHVARCTVLCCTVLSRAALYRTVPYFNVL